MAFEKLYFESKEWAEAYSAAEEVFRWGSPDNHTIFRWEVAEDDNGWYVMVELPNEWLTVDEEIGTPNQH
jgi:hypothetical protein